MTYKKEHITIFLHYNILWNNKPKLLYFSYIQYILHTDNVKQRQYHGTTNLTIVTENQKTKTLALPYREPHQRTPGCCLNSWKWLTLAFVCAVQLVILWTYSHDSQINCACALQMFALHLQISHGYDYVFNRLCQKQVEAWFYVFNAGCGIFCQPWCHLYDIFCG